MTNQPDLPDTSSQPTPPTDPPTAPAYPTAAALSGAPAYPSADALTIDAPAYPSTAALPEAPAYPTADTLTDAPAYPTATATATTTDLPGAPTYPTPDALAAYATTAPLQPPSAGPTAPPAYPTAAPIPTPAPAPDAGAAPGPDATSAPAGPDPAEAPEVPGEADGDAGALEMTPALAAAMYAALGTTETEQQLEFSGGRVEMRARQRGADATAISSLLLHLPNFICSFIVVYLIAGVLPSVLTWVLVVLWLASGALVFHRPTEKIIARYLLNLRYPTRKELAWLSPIWSEVSKRAGIEGAAYDLWIEDSGDLNAYAAAGHIVGVTHFSMTTLPPAEMAGVLAHELGHHTGGHAWSSLLGLWYSLPGRLAWQALRKVTSWALVLARYFFCLGAAILLAAAGLVIAAALTFWPLLLVLAAPYLLAAVSRKAELRADRTAAELGFAQVMVQVLTKIHGEQLEAQRQPGADGKEKSLSPGLAAKLLSSHPDYHTRLRQLEDYLPQQA